MTDPETIRVGFPHPELATISGKPDFENIKVANRELNSNSSSVASNLGNGLFGHLALTVPPALYLAQAGVDCPSPINPGSIVIPDPGTAAQIAAVERLHKENLRVWNSWVNVDKALKNQLMKRYDEMYYRSLRNRHTGYAGVTCLRMLTHLYDTYGEITDDDWDANDLRMKAPYDVSQPIELLFDQIDGGMEYAAAAGTPYTTEQVLKIAYNLVARTKMFKDECKIWRTQTANYKTWAQFQVDFAISYKEMHDNQTEAENLGYGGANAAVAEEALANLAAATVSDRTAVAMLTNTNATLSTELANANAKIAALTADILALKVKNARLEGESTGRSSGNREGRGGRTNGGGRGEARVNRPRTNRRYDNQNYCWTCGYDIAPSHTSANCFRPNEGPQHSATFADNKGGSQKNRNLVE
jgi:hypothetical protein